MNTRLKMGAGVAALALFAFAPQSASAADAAHPTVVELFQSQGCSSCPPAEANVGAISDRPDVLALAFEVDYWDRLGWKDPYSSTQATRRQRLYAGLLHSASVYTPQMVVDGRTDVVGSDRATALREPDRHRAAPVSRREPAAGSIRPATQERRPARTAFAAGCPSSSSGPAME